MADYKYSGQKNLEAMQEAKNYNNYLANIVRKNIPVDENNGIQVLDFGAGIGTYVDILGRDGLKIDCLEIDHKQAEILRSKGYHTYEDIKELKGKYDVIYAFNVFEHIEEDSNVLLQLAKKLKPKGLIIIYVPANKILHSAMDELVGHYRRYDLKMLKTLAVDNGLKVEKLRYCDPIGYFVTLLYKIVGSGSGEISGGFVKAYDTWLFPVSRIIEGVTQKVIGKNALLVVSEPKEK